jgi:hypothetical protein
MAAITADLKTKGLALRMGNSLHCTAFLRFRGPQGLKETKKLGEGVTVT